MEIFPTSLPVLVSRILHMLSSGLLLGGSVVPFLYRGSEALYPKFFAITAVVSVITGMYNAHVLQPARMKEKAATWRTLIYGGKMVIVILTTPLLEKVAGAMAPELRLGLVVLAFIWGTYCRFYREKYQQPLAKSL